MDPIALATTTIRRSWQHMAASVALCLSILTWYAQTHAPRAAFLGVGMIGLCLVGYNLVRIRRAQAALDAPETLPAFVTGQRTSHRVRGRIFLVTAPVLLAVVWVSTARTEGVTRDTWALLVACTVFLAVGWVFWLRVVRRLG